MFLRFVGAVGTVTGSATVLNTNEGLVLIDFGLFQGDKEADAKNIVPDTLPVEDIRAVVITHGHLDHVGRLPLLWREGYRGDVWMTSATADMASLVLRDSAHVIQSDYERRTKRAKNRGQRMSRYDEPLFDIDDVENVLSLFRSASNNDTWIDVCKGVSVRFHEAGHMLGSVSIEMKVTAGGAEKTIVFSGDIGPCELPFLTPPRPPKSADYVVMESTYGDRNHRSLSDTMKEFAGILNSAYENKGKVLIPAFAIGRTQQILFHLTEFFRDRIVPEMPVFLDSPMAINATSIYEDYPELWDRDSRDIYKRFDISRAMPSLVNSVTAEDSKRINQQKGPFIVIAGAGMANAGRIRHHLRNNLENPNAHVVITGFQARGSLGRMLVDGAKVIKMFGDLLTVRAQVHTIGGLSAHAGQSELIQWLSHLAKSKPTVLLNHGEESARSVLMQRIIAEQGLKVSLPQYADVFQL